MDNGSIKYQTMHQSKSRLQKNSARTTTFCTSKPDMEYGNGSQHQISNYVQKNIKITKEQFQNHNFLHIETRYGVWTMEARIKYQTMHRSKSRLQKNSPRTTTLCTSKPDMEYGQWKPASNIKLCTEANQDYKRTVPEPQLFAHPNQIWSTDNGSQHQISNYAPKQIKSTKEHNFRLKIKVASKHTYI
ncbi:hypothetical protein Adt_03067 [Abeliophyllum distichum]|uniref:Uncharacterized protein n=1 Tax=Abeliophyllum distichum TaxID=126358 RepID=A0ABD1VXH1_9LAMI